MADEKPVTATSLREKARQIREHVERRVLELREAAEREADKYERAAAAIEALGRENATGLTSDADSTILPNVIANSSGKLARGISRSRSKKHPFVRALYENPDPKKRMTVTDWAKKNGYKPGTAATWVKDPKKSDGARRIPRDAVEKIRAQYGLGDEAWAVGITEPE